MLHILYIIIIVFVVVVVMFQNHQVIVLLWVIVGTVGAAPKVPIVAVPATSGGRWVREEMEEDSDIVVKDVCEWMVC